MQYFPLFVDTQSLQVLVIGAGDVASRKLDLLCRTQAQIKVIALDVCQDTQAYVDAGRISLEKRSVTQTDIQDCDLLYLCTANTELNEQLAVVAKQQGIWANVVDNPKFCRFITPSIVDRGRLQIAISTAGAAPVYARELRARLESWLPQSITPLFDFIAERRTEVQQRLPIFKQRRVFWEKFFQRNDTRFDDYTEKHYQSSFEMEHQRGELLLIDADTDASLLPIGAMPYLQKIEVAYTRLTIPFALNELLRRDANVSDDFDEASIEQLLAQGESCLIFGDIDEISHYVKLFPNAKYLKAGSF
ncbi:precorrin-2 dehydrogenase/sirohydrochlorin ferrochelatase family protein [Shewanella fidelis]|uniref:precorrin-2 dehydrogenase n=1 Tax=Shewanella fidelis TaxID=173509 RepID=A0AAW8NMC8_9GAMM|nr:bifunctional precorrin-2 dehydrogenase/sirohydrochlorin ferrochelatase [Shewanella fidelis]MDR8524353.1 bifunctional precorrin-2 dehydrogenase/sirohydrochlorin ferrochelatase [Shewanella fidelis]MDW4813438.1 bifunctional precorrin-2 dehydrogenase/sirohydrochlorin ferrochelatase [Shewanella fidelis]MDW4817639.1 bifunctional precorrin-2 dehydrogenase/sirohydrochlorin ferrochelatase [Shewanella fidelis]MDW4821706.1 bifunctional precorrin-2 dehydrogenase/sirohydrochlorin ferrochelatase [Shewanel